MGCFWPKYIIFGLKKLRRVIFDGTEYWCQIWSKTGLWFQRWHEEFDKFSPEHSKVSKSGLWWDLFIQNRKCYELKIFKAVMCHDNVEWCKAWTGIDLQLQNWLEEFDKIWPVHSKISKIYNSMGCFWPEYIIMFELKKYWRVMFDGTEDWCEIWRKTDSCFQKWHEEFDKFSQAEK